MATRRQTIKDIENKQAQARDHYAKNKTLLSEYQVKEKADDYKKTAQPKSAKSKEESI